MSEQTYNQMMEPEKIDLMRLINNMWKGLKSFWLLFLALIVGMGGIFVARAHLNYSPVYRASATFTIESSTSTLYSSSYMNTRTAEQIVNTFSYILSSGQLQKKVAQELETESVPGSVSAEILGSTNMITLEVSAKDPQDAYDILQAVILYYPEVAEPIIGEVSMYLLDMTDVPASPSNSVDYKNRMIKGMCFGAMCSLVILFIHGFYRKTILTDEDLKYILNLECICSIPHIIFKRRGNTKFCKDISIYNKKIPQAFLESMRVLRTRVEKDAKRKDLKVFLVTSAESGEGKSTIAANVAMSLAMLGGKTALVDCDLRNPSLDKDVEIEKREQGLCDYLVKNAELEDICLYSEAYKMYVIPGGKPVSNAAELLDTDRMKELIARLKEQVDYVILDTAPVGLLTDTAVLAQSADAALFVVKQDYAKQSVILDAISQLSESKIYISGCILNGIKAGIGGYGYGKYQSYNRYGYYKNGSHYRMQKEEE